MDPARAFQPFGLAHLVVILLTIALPFVLAAFVRTVLDYIAGSKFMFP